MTALRDRLVDLAQRIEGTAALALVAIDGLPIESISPVAGIDVELLAAELVAQMRAMDENHREFDVGPIRHLGIRTSRYDLLISAAHSDHFLLLVTDRSTGSGRARFELRRALDLFEDELR